MIGLFSEYSEHNSNITSGKINNVSKKIARKFNLTPRETEVLALIAQYGYSNQELSKHFYVTESTIKNHIANIANKTGLRTSRGLLSLIVRETILLEQEKKLQRV